MNTTTEFASIIEEIIALVRRWENIFITLSPETTTKNRNKQERNVKQILGHMIDSASNNHQRMVRLQYTPKLEFPDYTLHNDQWIAIQNYQKEHWITLVQLWKYFNLHIAHLISHVDKAALKNSWIDSDGEKVTLGQMIYSYLSHLKLHLNEIEELIGSE